MVVERLPYGKYLKTGDPVEILAESKNNLAKFLDQDEGLVFAEIRQLFLRGRNPFLCLLASLTKVPEELVKKLLSELGSDIETQAVEIGKYLGIDEKVRPSLWWWLLGEAEKKNPELIILSGFEGHEGDWDVLIYQVVQGGDNYPLYTQMRGIQSSILILPGIDFRVYLNAAWKLSNRGGFMGRVTGDYLIK